METENINPDPFIEDDTDDDEWEYDDKWRWEPSCAMDCEDCGCHGDCPDCGTDEDFYDVDDD